MPWLSRTPSHPSPLPSPRPTSPRQLSGSKQQQQTPPISYIPPLIDGACGTVPAAQKRGSLALLWEDIKEIRAAAPGIATALRGVLSRRQGEGISWTAVKDVLVHMILTPVEVLGLLLIIPLWITLPGILFAAIVSVFLSAVVWISRFVNGDDVVVTCDGSGSWSMEPEHEDERWIFVGGMGMSIDHLASYALPLLTRLFTHPMIGIHTPSYGLPFDVLLLALHRSMPSLQSQSTQALCTELRAALLDSSLSRVVVLAHTTGAVSVSTALASLSADIQPERLSKLEIYTFGAASREFVVPLGETRRSPHAGSTRHDETEFEDRGPHIEHFAFTSDPFAQMGVLRAVHRDPGTRFCGGVFTIHSRPPSRTFHARKTQARANVAPPGQFADYLAALFPSAMPFPLPAPSGSSVLDYAMSIDRDTAEKRELAAMESYAETRRSRKESRRTSWTGLGATVGSSAKNGVMDGVVGLERVRRGCRECDGLSGRDVSRLAGYIRGASSVIIEGDDAVVDALGVGMGRIR